MKRNKTLDILRGIAIILVLFTHHYAFPPLYHAGWTGVDLFFVLSGFLISGLLFSEYKNTGKIEVMRFLIRRGFKIYPQFYLMLVITLILVLIYPLPVYNSSVDYFYGIEWKRLIGEIFFLQNYLGGIWIHTWSLAVEEHFYLLISVFILLLVSAGKMESKKLWLTSGIIITLSCLILRMMTFKSPGYSYLTHLFPTHLRIDSLFTGVLIAWFAYFRYDAFISFRKRNINLLILMAFMPALAFFFPIDSFFTGTIGLTLIFWGFGSLIIITAFRTSTGKHNRHWWNLAGNALSQVGYYSYSIYIWHLFVKHYGYLLWVKLAPDFDNWLFFIFYFLFSIIAGIITAKIVEIPILKLRDKWFPSKNNPMAALTKIP